MNLGILLLVTSCVLLLLIIDFPIYRNVTNKIKKPLLNN